MRGTLIAISIAVVALATPGCQPPAQEAEAANLEQAPRRALVETVVLEAIQHRTRVARIHDGDPARVGPAMDQPDVVIRERLDGRDLQH